MKRLIYALLMLILLTGGALVPQRTAAQADSFCYKGTLTYTNTSAANETLYVTLYDSVLRKVAGGSVPVVTLKPGETFDGEVQAVAPAGTSYDFVYSVGKLDPTLINRVGASIIEPCSLFNDGRLNWADPAAPIVVYYEQDKHFDIFAVNPDNGNGTRILRLLLSDIRTAVARAETRNENGIIRQLDGLTVYALAGGTCQVNTWQFDGKPYEFEWACNIAPS